MSITTVSRILNDRESGVPIRQATRDRVLGVAADLGYRPNLLARGLRGSRSSLLGVIARDMSDPFHIQILRGINEVARQRDHRAVPRPRRLPARGGDRLRLDVRELSRRRHHRDGRHPLAAARRHSTCSPRSTASSSASPTARRAAQIPGVYADSAAGTQLAMDHLWELGHRSIVCVSDNRTYDGRLRIDRYERYMHEQRRRRPDPGLHHRPGAGAGVRARPRMFAGFDERRWPTAIYATSDTTAIGLMQAAFQAGVAIPDRLSIVGYDDIDIAPFTIPPLTTISQAGDGDGRVGRATCCSR